MADNTSIIVATIVVVLLVIGFGAMYFYKNSPSIAGYDNGRVVFAITDAAANMGSVSKVEITVDKIEAHSQTEGWITVSSTSKKYDLLELKADNKQVILADAQLNEGSYDQVRLDVSSVVVTDTDGTHEAKLPSGELKIVGGFNVSSNTTATVKFDFIADESLHITGNGQYIFAPVVQVESRNDADVNVKSNNEVEISGGRVVTNVKVGTDIDGNVGVGLHIPSNVNITIGSDNVIKIGSGSSNANANSGSGIGIGY